MAAPPRTVAQSIAALRRFNRFYRRELRGLRKALEDGGWPSNQAQVLFEIHHGNATTAEELAGLLVLPGSLSQCINKLVNEKFITRREKKLALTKHGREALEGIEAFERKQAKKVLDAIPQKKRNELIDALILIEELLTKHPPKQD